MEIDDDHATRARRALASCPNRGRLALAELPESYGVTQLLLEKTAFAAYPGEPGVLLLIAWGSLDPSIVIAALRPALPRVLKSDRDEEFRALFASHYLAALLELGRAEDAVALWDVLSPPLRARVLRGGDTKFTIDGVDVEMPVEPVRLPLAAALALADRGDEAPPLVRIDNEKQKPLVALLQSFVTRSADDPFDIFAAFYESRAEDPPELVWHRLLLDIGPRHGYARAAQWLYEKAIPHYMLPDAVSLDLPQDVLAELARVRVENKRLLRLEPHVAPRDERAGTMARILAAPRIVPFTEKPMPADLPPLVPGNEGAVWDPETPYVIRSHQSGAEVVNLIGTTEGYALRRSHDGGVTWDDSLLFTGMRGNDPYLPVQPSALPLIEGGRVRIEIEFLDPERDRVYLDMAMNDLARDSDGDGLADLVEEGMFTDPSSSDTDHDGVRDAEDLLPLVASFGGRSDESEILGIVLAELGETTIFEASREDFRHVVPREHRILVLTPEEIEMAEKKLGPLFENVLAPLLIDQKRSKAFVYWSTGSTGGRGLLERKDGVWVKMTVNTWITLRCGSVSAPIGVPQSSPSTSSPTADAPSW